MPTWTGISTTCRVGVVQRQARYARSTGPQLQQGHSHRSAATYVVLGVLGWFIQDTAADIVARNEPDHLLHLASGARLVAVALGADTRARTRV